MAIIALGVSHRTAPIEMRERFAFVPSEIPSALDRVRRTEGVSESVLLSTCNRTEIYACAHEDSGAIGELTALLGEHVGDLPRPPDHYLYVHRDLEAVHHLYRVAAGLDSMVLGEVEIQGQVREAYETARGVTGERPVVGPVLSRLFQTALSVGGTVRTRTRLSEGAGSVPSAAIELARKIFGTLRGRRGMVLGTGEMGALTLRCLMAEGMRDVAIVSREPERAVALAGEVGGTALAYADLWERLAEVDVVIAATAAPHPVLGFEPFVRAVPDRSRSPLFIVDIAVPRDVEPEIGGRPDVFLYTIDDLEGIVASNFERRRDEVPRAEEIIAEAGSEFWRWYAGLEAVPLIRGLRAKGEAIRRSELERALSNLSHLDPEDRERIERLTRSLLAKILHEPTTRLRAVAENGADPALLEVARYLFAIEGEAGGEGEEENGGERRGE